MPNSLVVTIIIINNLNNNYELTLLQCSQVDLSLIMAFVPQFEQDLQVTSYSGGYEILVYSLDNRYTSIIVLKDVKYRSKVASFIFSLKVL